MKRQIRRSFHKDYFAIDLVDDQGLIHATPVYLKPGERAPMLVNNCSMPLGWLSCEFEYSNGHMHVVDVIGDDYNKLGEDPWMPTNEQLQDETWFRFPIKTRVTITGIEDNGDHQPVDTYISLIPADDKPGILREAAIQAGNVNAPMFFIEAVSGPENGNFTKLYFISRSNA